MAAFKNTKEVIDAIGGLFEWAGGQKEIADRLRGTGVIIRLNYTEPDAMITIDCANPPRKAGGTISWFEGTGDVTPEVEFFMKSDIAHKFWLGKVNLLVALTKRDTCSAPTAGSSGKYARAAGHPFCSCRAGVPCATILLRANFPFQWQRLSSRSRSVPALQRDICRSTSKGFTRTRFGFFLNNNRSVWDCRCWPRLLSTS